MITIRRIRVAVLVAALLCSLVWQTAGMQSPLRRITNTSEEGASINPSMSGDGRIVAFESTEDVASTGGPESFRAIRANINVDPPAFVQLAASRAPAPAVSQDGSRIAFASSANPLGTNADGNSEIFLHDGETLRQITNTTPGDISTRTVHGNFLPSISDDGRFIAFSSNRDLAGQNGDGNLEIFIYDNSSSAFSQLTNSSGIVGFSDAKISGNALNVAYMRDAAGSPSVNRDLLLQNRTGSPAIRTLVTNASGLELTYGRAISDDGQRVVWAADIAANSSQVFLYDGRNNQTRQITSLGTRVTDVPLHPTISGNGSRIAFATRRSFLGNSDGSVDLYSFDLPSSTFARITTGPSNATAEVLSSMNDDGSLVAFHFPRVLTSATNAATANNSEIYITKTPSRPGFGTLTVLNGASFGHGPSTTDAVAPDSIAVARGGALAFSSQQSQQQQNGSFPLSVGGTTVTVNGRPAQIFFVSPSQVNFLVPPQTELGTAEVVVTNSEGFQSRGTITTLRAAPGVFTVSGDGLGEGVILNADTLQPGPFDPTDGDLRLVIFTTGVRNASNVTVAAGGRTLTIESNVQSSTMPGLDEIHVLVPADLRGAGTVELVVDAEGRDSNPVTVTFSGDAVRNIVINELLADPPANSSDPTVGDANNDGARSGSEDEFIELINSTANDIDLSGYQLLTRSGTATSDVLRHTFDPGTILQSCGAIVVFGGGDPDPSSPIFGGSQILTASRGSLGLNNASGLITLRDSSGNIANFFVYGGSTGLEAGEDQSLTRSPDVTGAFAQHLAASGGAREYSPGTRLNGAAFSSCTPAIARVEVTPASAVIEAGEQQLFTARAFDATNNAVPGVIFFWESNNTGVGTIDQHGNATGVSPGTAEIHATGRGVQSAPATLTVTQRPLVLTSITIIPVSATIAVGETQQFNAQAKDQFGQDIGGVTITFASSDTAVATVDVVSSTSSTGFATATITGRAVGSADITASASDGSTTVTSPRAVLTVEPGAGQLLISEFRTRGPAGAADEFVEIYNPTTTTLPIGGLRIRASNSSGTISDRVTITAGATLGPGCHYLLANGSSRGYSGTTPPDQTYNVGITDNGGIAITGSNGTSVIDAVGMSGGSAFNEGNMLTPLSGTADQSYERKPGGSFGNGVDTNDNAGDFTLTTPSNPQNSSSVCLNPGDADLSISKTDSPDPVTTGANVTYTIVVANNGVATAQNVVVTDDLPGPVTFVSCNSTGSGVCNGSGNNRTITFASLSAGASETITLVATANGAPGSSITNTATVTSATADSNGSNNQSTTTTTVQAPVPALSIDDAIASEGPSGTTTFTFTVSLSTPAPAVGVTFDIATQDNSATAVSSDYVSQSLTSQTISSGNTSYSFGVTVNGDTLVEPDEAFFVNITNVTGADVSDSQGTGTITNDDFAMLVISQVYAGGGNTGAPFANDFVEVFNRGTTTVSFGVTPYSIQYAGATASFRSNRVDLTTGTLLPGRYYLVQLSSGGSNGVSLPSPDATGSINMASTAGKVSLVVGTTALPVSDCPGDDGVAPFNPNDVVIADFVGYGSSANCYEGAGPAPAPGNTSADFRAGAGCLDTDQNNSDFSIAGPNPRNSASPLNNCNVADLSIIKTDSPDPVVTGSKVTYTIVVTNNGGAISQNVLVTDNLPASVTFVSCNASGTGVCGGSGNNRTISYAAIANGASETITLVATANGAAGTTITNIATISSDTPDPDTTENSSTSETDVQPPAPILSIDNVVAAEGDLATTTLTFTVSLSLPAPSGGVTFDIATEDNTATSGSGDYVAKSLTNQTIASGHSSYTFDITVNGDTLVEPGESFFVNVTNVSGAAVSDGQGEGTIQNDDVADLVISQLYSGGGNSGAQFTHDFIEVFNRGATTVDLSGWSVQYVSATGSGTWSATSLSGLIKPGQYYLVQEAAGAGNGIALPLPDTTGSIAMAATAGKVALVSSTTRLSGICPASASIADLIGYGTTASCFEGSGRARAPGATTADFRRGGGCVDTNDNTADFFVLAPFPRNTAAPFNNCTPAAPASLMINDVTIAEGNGGPTIATFTVSLSTPAQGTDVTFDIATADGTAQDDHPAASEDNDYVAKSLTNQMIPAGQQTYTFTVIINGDTAIEADQTFFVNLTNVSGALLGDGHGVGTIQNDDNPTLSINDVSLAEGNADTKLFTFTVSLSATAAAPVTFDIATADDTAQDDNPAASEDHDYVGRSETAQVIPAGQSTYSLDVTVNGDENIEPHETFFVNVTNVSGAIAGDGHGVGTIQNDDSPSLSITDVFAAETDSGTTTFTFIVTSTLSAPPGGITFDIATVDGTAQDDNPDTEDNDYVAKSLTSQTIPFNQTQYTFDVTVNGDTLVEPNETFFVNLSNVSNATVGDGQGLGMIQNDDAPLVAISQLYGAGGNSGATLRNDFIEIFNRGTTTVDLSGWSVQYTSATGTSWQVTPLCPSGPCLLLPGKYFLVQEASGGGNGALLPFADVTGTISMAATSGKVALVANTTALTGNGCASGSAVLDFVGYGTTPDCFEGTGRAPAPGTITAGVRKGGACVDTNDNAADFFLHTPSPRNNSFPANSCNGQTVDLTINDVAVTETDSGTVTTTFTVTLHGSTGSTVTVDYSTADNSANAPADYQAISTTQLTFSPGETTKTITVNINDDITDEPNETFFANLSNAANAALLDNQGLGTITDNDVQPALTINDVSINEGDAGTTIFAFTVHLSTPALTGGVTFDIATTDGAAQDDDPVTEDNDYVPQSFTSQTIPAGSQDFVFNVAVSGDSSIEPNETFFVNITNVSGATVSDGQGQGTIQNDDSPSLSIDDVTAVEGDSGTTVFSFTISSSLPAPAGGITFDIATADGTAQDDNPATEDNDYTAHSLTGQSIPEGQTTYTFNVNVNGDTKDEAACETFFVNLSNVTNATVLDGQGQGGITDEDGTKLVISQIYGGGGNAGATYTNDFIEIFNRGNTPVSLNGMSVQYSAATSTSGNYAVTILPNVTLQPGQYFLIQENGGVNGVALPIPDATGTITMAAGAGKVALVNGIVPLPAVGCPSGATIIDFVGYGTTANCRESTTTADNAPGPSNNSSSSQRDLSGCQDSNNNQQDFAVAPVVPRNTATELNSCGCSAGYSSNFVLFREISWMVFRSGKQNDPVRGR